MYTHIGTGNGEEHMFTHIGNKRIRDHNAYVHAYWGGAYKGP